MTGRTDGRVAVVTGGALGIGGATARRLAAEGARVLIADVEEAAAEDNARRIRAAGGTAEVSVVDVAEAADAERMVRDAVDRWGRLDILVQNAFSPTPEHPIHGAADEVADDGWEWGMRVLAKALYLGARFAVPEMRQAGGGSIVNIASVHGLLQAPRSLVYEAGKSAVIGMTRQMACDYGPDGIRVNAVCPGLIVTERGQTRWTDDAPGLAFRAEQYPVRRTGVPDDVAGAIAFLCSDDASFITGHALVVDGGLTIQLQENLGIRLAQYAQEHPELDLTKG
jgi:NAD(P)-dependent dehydrogenase (short-subunit alcohol dehydrogenase family)